MNIQKIFKAGNSNVVAIPADILTDLKIKTGDKVIVERASDNEIVVKKSTPVKARFGKAQFNQWLTRVLKEDAEILDELAKR